MGADGWVLEEGALAAALNLQPGGVKLVNDFVAVGLAVTGRLGREGGGADDGARGDAGGGRHKSRCSARPASASASACGWRARCPPTVGGGERRVRAPPADDAAEHVRGTSASRIKVEHVVSGAGLKHIYDFLRSAAQAETVRAPPTPSRRRCVPPTAPAPPSRRAHCAAEGADADCVAAVDLFVEALGEAANLALPGLRRRVHRRRRDGEAGAPRRQREAERRTWARGRRRSSTQRAAPRRHDGGRRPRWRPRPVCQVRPRRR